jgi:uncharacterized membrane protein
VNVLPETPVQAAPAPAKPPRFERLDAARGLAVIWMAAFHFCFDLNYFGWMRPYQQFLADPFWTRQRTAIVSLFLLCAGVGQAVAWVGNQTWPRFWARWAQVAGCAVLVSAGTAIQFPGTWISFGVLHGVAAMLLIVRLLRHTLGPKVGEARDAPVGWVLGLLGLAALAGAAPRLWGSPVFNGRWLNWTGLVSRLPVTEDYVPVLPWLGVVLAGVALGLLLLRLAPRALSGAVPRAFRPLAVLGRWSLSFYMIHQPVLFGGLLAWQHWHPR